MENQGDRTMRHYHAAEPVTEIMARLSLPITECGCHAWLGKIGTGGYPQVAYRVGGKRLHRKAATVAYELAYGRVPEGKEISHFCLQEWCVNPDHLLAETHLENMQRVRPFDRRTWGGFCKRGHPLPPSNERNKNGSCPICYREYQASWKAKNKAYAVEYVSSNRDAINAKRRERRYKQKEN